MSSDPYAHPTAMPTDVVDPHEPLRELKRVVEAMDANKFRARNLSEPVGRTVACCPAAEASKDAWFREHTAINQLLKADARGWVTADLPAPDADVPAILADVFRITPADANALFALAQYRSVGPNAISREAVLANIDRLLAGQPAEPYPAVGAKPTA